MKVSHAIFFVSVGIWIAFSYPDFATMAFQYINAAFIWGVQKFNELRGIVE